MLSEETYLLTYPGLIGLSLGRSIWKFLSGPLTGLGRTLTTGICDTFRSALTALPMDVPTFSS